MATVVLGLIMTTMAEKAYQPGAGRRVHPYHVSQPRFKGLENAPVLPAAARVLGQSSQKLQQNVAL